MQILAGAGISTHQDAYAAGHAATRAALVPLESHPPRLVVIFTTDAYDGDAVLQGVRTQTGSAPLVGCCTGGLISVSGHHHQGVAVLALYAPDMTVSTALHDELSEQPMLAAERVTESLLRTAPAHSQQPHTALVFADGLIGRRALDDALYTTSAILGPGCPLAGGAAGDSLKFVSTSLFADDQISSDALAVALVASSAPVGIGVRHGWQPMGPQFTVTHSEDNVLYELDGRPPLEVYRELFPQQTITAETFLSVTRFHPLGFQQDNQEYLIRLPQQANPDGSVVCAGIVPVGAVAHVMQGDAASLLHAAQQATQQAVAALHGQPPAAALIIDCVTRPPLLGEETDTEIARIRQELGPNIPFIGMYSFGEVASEEAGAVAFHNKTVVVYVIGQPTGTAGT
jgi:hypothetical protein